ncbi:PRKAR2B [Cordylochernes scorpioides]|uniref:PRKAR2B n=1 Tax=Cordylochernes scorpioides TaxID=51811 RepID=A0ABY6LIB7_9ARAC|nr:PRKAR2B [Cordylochernes scorpioides]
MTDKASTSRGQGKSKDDDDENDAIEDSDTLNLVRSRRRGDVFAEQYNPEVEDAEETDLPNYPKSPEEKEKLRQAISNIFLFRDVTEEQMERVLQSMEKKKVKAGDVIIQQGASGDYFYVIESGSYEFVVTDSVGKSKEVSTLEHEGSFGELALMYNQPRAATVTALTDGELWAMSRQTFRTILLSSAYKKRKQYEEFLSKVEILDVLTPYERSNLCDALETQTYGDKAVIFREGDEAHGMYLVEKGQVRISSSKESNLALLNAGDYFGELALITKRPRAATATAVGKTYVAFLNLGAFERLLGPCMEVLKKHIDAYKGK